MTLSNSNDLSIVELIFYTPACLFSIFLCLRHGFGMNKGWVFLLIFSLIRIAGASVQLATIGSPTSIPLLTTAALLASIGLSPLLLTVQGLQFRVWRSINKEHRTLIQPMTLRVAHLPIFVGLLLIIFGMDGSAAYLKKHGTFPTEVIAKIGVLLLVAVFAFVVLTTAMFMFRSSHAEPGERRLLNAIAASLPSLVRMLYIVLIMFSNIRMFSILHGSIVALACIAVMQEIIVVLIYIAVGITLPRRIKKSKESQSNETQG
jgi:uncharacterized membrane protein SirB2